GRLHQDRLPRAQPAAAQAAAGRRHTELAGCASCIGEMGWRYMSVKAFTVNVSQKTLDELRTRLAMTRFPDEVEDTGWDCGTNLAYLKELVRYWQDEFNWRAQEESMNRFAHFRADVDGLGIHFIHERGKGENPLPIILTHGYPDSFWRFQKLIPLLIEEKDGLSFDVVAPSIPGYGFSDKPKEKGTLFKVHDLWAKLMSEELGYEKFAAHGGDF